ncbi:VIR protein [Plasmodium vivax]|uniref:VIR protein n=1 Tax=Plasmodium vivax TaxID=5855 RepID=A0A1G4EE74_PLAVI|nr:VIR protein [Plasmodium vivax]
MAWLFRGFSRYINPYQKHDSASCMNTYSKLKDDIYQRIDRFNNDMHTNIYNEWHELYKYINAKNASIKHCVDDRYINSDFSKDDKINNFKSICDNKRICRINKNPPLKKTGTVEPCRKGKNCKTVTAETTGKGKLRPELEGEPSKATRLQGPKAQETSREHAGREESNRQSEVLPAQLDAKFLPNSIKSEDNEPESVGNKHSSTSVLGSTSTQALADIGDTPTTELNLQAEDSPSQSSSPGESIAGGTLRVSYSDRSLPQSNLSDDQTLDANHSNMQTHQGGGAESQDHNHKNLDTELADRVSLLGNDFASEKLDNEGSVDRDNNRQDNNDVTNILQAASPLDTRNEDVVIAPTEVVSSGDTSPIRETYGDKDVRGAVNDREIKNGQERDSEHICNGIPCNAENGNGLDTGNGNKSDILGKIFEAISDKDHIIQASAPMGIVLLLGLLFKYTPLWRVLTKKNRKKGAGINEELNTVLQEPSIMDDERSIPLSYGAFEYSAFDQNSY